MTVTHLALVQIQIVTPDKKTFQKGVEIMRQRLSEIYCFVNKINGKKYVGQAQDIFDRKNQHKYRAFIETDSGYRMAFHAAIRKYGWNSFDFYILQLCNIEDLDRKEDHWIYKLDTKTPKGYNIITKNHQYRKKKQQQIKTKKKNKLPDDEIDLVLIDKILTTSFEAVAKEYGYTSGNAIKKRLLAKGIPNKKKQLFEYWKKHTGKEHPLILKQKMRQKEKEKHNKKFAPKKVAQIEKNSNNIVAIFPSTKEAQRQTGISSGRISECARGIYKYAGGYIWRYMRL